MTTHYLKCWPIFFFEAASGMKTFEIRKNDRDFRVGDIIVLQYWDPLTKDYNKAYSAFVATNTRNLNIDRLPTKP